MNVAFAISARRPLMLQERRNSGHSESAAMCQNRKSFAHHQDVFFLPFVCGLATPRNVSMKSWAIELSVRFSQHGTNGG
jgi:hypothetical protein